MTCNVFGGTLNLDLSIYGINVWQILTVFYLSTNIAWNLRSFADSEEQPPHISEPDMSGDTWFSFLHLTLSVTGRIVVETCPLPVPQWQCRFTTINHNKEESVFTSIFSFVSKWSQSTAMHCPLKSGNLNCLSLQWVNVVTSEGGAGTLKVWSATSKEQICQSCQCVHMALALHAKAAPCWLSFNDAWQPLRAYQSERYVD